MRQIQLIVLLFAGIAVQAQERIITTENNMDESEIITLENDLVRREMISTGERLEGRSYRLTATGREFMRKQSPEFSVMIDDSVYTGLSYWNNIQVRDTADLTGGKGKVISLRNIKKGIVAELTYLLYPHLPVVYKVLRIINTGQADIKVEAIDVENFKADLPGDSWIMKHYARDRTRESYIGNWNDALVLVHNPFGQNGIAVGNMAFGVTKRTTVFLDGQTLTAGLTYPDQDYGFRRWLCPGEDYTSPGVFTAVYENSPDGAETLNLTVPGFIRCHGGMRIEQLPRKPMFVYNTWEPFFRNISDSLVRSVAEAAAACGVEEFVIDDGWQTGPGNGDHSGTAPTEGDWTIDSQKFPGGLRPVFDYIKSLGMKPGLWVSISTSVFSESMLKEHADWFVRDKNGEIANLHLNYGLSKTACLATDWYDYIKDVILGLVNEHGLAYVKLDLAIVTSPYVSDRDRTGCYAGNHPFHRDREESYEAIYRRCMALFDELHEAAPELFIDCTYETAGKYHLMDYGIARHAEGNWLANIGGDSPSASLRVRNLAWGRTPAIPATSLVTGNLPMNGLYGRLNFKSLAGTLHIMLGDPRKLTKEDSEWFKTWSSWLKMLEQRHGFMSFRQDLPGFGEPAEGCWDGFSRINTETFSGGLVGVFRHGAKDETRTAKVPWLQADKTYIIRHGADGATVATLSGKDLAEKGFTVTIKEKYDGELFEIVEVETGFTQK
jgi:alpha-galactosidase